MPLTDLQFKDELRRDRDMYEQILDHIKNGEIERASALLEREISRINESLQD